MCMSSFLAPLQTPSSYRGGADMALKHPNNHCPPPHPPHYVPFHPLAWLTSKNTNTSTTRDSSKERENEKEKKESRCESPRSVLDASKELESRKNRVGLGIVVALEEEDEANITSPVHCQTLLIAVSPRCQTPRPYKELNTRHESSPIAIPSHAGYTTLLHVTHHEHEEEEEEEEDEFDEVDDSFLWPNGKEVVEEEEDEDDEEEREKVEERERRKGFVRSIFSVGTPLVSALHEENDDDDDEEEEEEVGWPIMEELLKACFLCKRSFGDGKDIYMYRGDRAFCSEECRYRQIVVDEYHERKIEGLRPY